MTTPIKTDPQPVWCFDHLTWECAHIDFVDDPNPKIKMPKPVGCHKPVKKGPWCKRHRHDEVA